MRSAVICVPRCDMYTSPRARTSLSRDSFLDDLATFALLLRFGRFVLAAFLGEGAGGASSSGAFAEEPFFFACFFAGGAEALIGWIESGLTYSCPLAFAAVCHTAIDRSELPHRSVMYRQHKDECAYVSVREHEAVLD
eukprot:SAG25_NODE_1882_length_2210_cov_1.815727_4_plen_138_part_00